MKKLLALVLALVMTLGLATVSTSAAYSDANDIDYTEAVDVMTAVGVFQGKGDAFAPKDGLNRAEAAKLIAYLMLGNKTAEAMKGTGAKFADVPASHWASGYIEYLNTAGVVSGVGGGNFDPNGQVTAVAFAKMLLVALGYDAEIEGFSGNSSWAINIQKLANDNDLYENLDLSSIDALNREQAAQMCLNDLKADMVEYDHKGTTVNVSGATVTTDAGKAEEIKRTESGSNKNYAGSSSTDDGYGTKQLCEDLYGNDLVLDSTGTDDMGRPAAKWTYKNVEIGTYGTTSDLIFSTADGAVKQNAMYKLIGKDEYKNFNKASGTNNDFEFYIDGKDVTADYAYTDLFQENRTGDVGLSGRAVSTELYKIEHDDYNTYCFVQVRTHLVQASGDYRTGSEDVSITFITENGDSRPAGFPSKIEQEDFNVKDVKEDDYLLITWSESDGSIQSVKPATMVTGKVSSFVKGDSITVDGTKYQYAKVTAKNTDMGSNIDFDIGSTVVLVTDGKHILAVDDKDASATYLYIEKSGSSGVGKYAEAQAYFTDGTSKTISVKKATYYTTNNGNAAPTTEATTTNTGSLAADALATQWYTYTTDDDGLYTIKAIGTTTDYTQYNVRTDAADNTQYNVLRADFVDFVYTNDQATPGGTTTLTDKGNSETVILVLDDDDDVTVYTGIDNIPDIKAKTGANATGGTLSDAITVSYILDGSYVKYAFVNVSAGASVVDDSTTSDDYLFILKKGDDTTDEKTGNHYVTYTAIQDGAETTVKVDYDAVSAGSNTTDAFPQVGVLYHKLHTNSKGYITSATVVGSKDKEYSVAANQNLNAIPALWKLADADGGNTTATSNAITYKSGTLSVGGLNMIVNSGASINLVVLGLDNSARDYNKYAGTTISTNLVKNTKATYATYLNMGGSSLADTLDDYDIEYDYFAVYSDKHTGGAGKIDMLYVFVYDATDKVVASDDASIASIKVKGLDVTKECADDGVDYEITLPYATATDAGLADFVVTATADGKATVVETGSTALTPWANFANPIATKSDMTLLSNPFYYKAVVTSEDTSNSTTVIIKVIAEPVVTLTAANATVNVTDPTTLTNGAVQTPAVSAGTDTLADLLAALTPSDGTIKFYTNGTLGGRTEVTDMTTTLTAFTGLTSHYIEVVSQYGTAYQWAVTADG